MPKIMYVTYNANLTLSCVYHRDEKKIAQRHLVKVVGTLRRAVTAGVSISLTVPMCCDRVSSTGVLSRARFSDEKGKNSKTEYLWKTLHIHLTL